MVYSNSALQEAVKIAAAKIIISRYPDMAKHAQASGWAPLISRIPEADLEDMAQEQRSADENGGDGFLKGLLKTVAILGSGALAFKLFTAGKMYRTKMLQRQMSKLRNKRILKSLGIGLPTAGLGYLAIPEKTRARFQNRLFSDRQSR